MSAIESEPTRVSVWSALLVAPSLTLCHLAVSYALVTPSCSRQNALALHAVSVVILALCAWLTLAAWREWHRSAASQGAQPAHSRRAFLAMVATMSALLSTLVVLAEWFPAWVLSPCAS